MIPVLLVVGLAIFIFCRHAFDRSDGWFNVFPALAMVLVTGVAILVLLIAATLVGHKADPELAGESTVELRLLNDNSTISGQFGGNIFAVAGHIEGELQYSFYQETEPGVFELRSISATETKVVETNRESGATLLTQRFWEGPMELTCGSCILWPKYGDWQETYEYRLEVPEGSIGYGINLDGE